MEFYFPFIIANLVIGYLFGSISWSIILGTKYHNKDPREFASKNAGATNSYRLYGKKTGIAVLLLDVLKSIIPTIIIWAVTKYVFFGQYQNYIIDNFSPLSIIFLCPFAALIGHCYPIFFKFKGGKGAASYGAFLFLISPWIALFSLIILVIIVKIKKKVSLAVLIVSLFSVFLIFIPGLNYWYIIDNNINNLIVIDYWPLGSFFLLFSLLLLSVGLVYFRHKENIERLASGNENIISKNNIQKN